MRLWWLLPLLWLLSGCSVVFSNLNPLTPQLPPPFALNGAPSSTIVGAPSGEMSVSKLVLRDSSAAVESAVAGDDLYVLPTFAYSGSRYVSSLTYTVSCSSPYGTLDSVYSGYSLTRGYDGTFASSSSSYSGNPRLRISSSAPAGAVIPLTYSLRDSGSSTYWTATSSVAVAQAVSLSLSSLNLAEVSGNGDGIPNKGETLYLRPTFLNSGARTAKSLTYTITTSNSAATIESPQSSTTIESLAPGATSTVPTTYYSPKLKLSSTVADGTILPLSIAVSDGSGKRWTLAASVTVAAPSVRMSVSLSLSEVTGNSDGRPNKGETLYLLPRFTNTGSASTNPLTVSVTTSSSYASVLSPGSGTALSVGAIGVNGTSPTPNSYYAPRLQINSSAPSGTTIPLTFKVSDSYGNEWSLATSLTVEAIAVSLALGNLTVDEQTGNGDDTPNKGETLYLLPAFRNSGSASTNAMTVSVTTSSSYASILSSGYGSSLSISAIGSGQTSPAPSTYYCPRLQISSTTPSGTSIPLVFTLTDSYGNQWTINGSLVVSAIAATPTLSSLTLTEYSGGNGDGRPNKGEALYLLPQFRNSGASSTNAMTVSVTTSSSYASILSSSYGSSLSISAIGSGQTSPTPSTYYCPRLQISGTTPIGTSIPLVFTLSDSYGNSWTLNYSLTTQ